MKSRGRVSSVTCGADEEEIDVSSPTRASLDPYQFSMDYAQSSRPLPCFFIVFIIQDDVVYAVDYEAQLFARK
jgi:hypothetical protein